MATKQGISTAKGFQENVPSSDNTNRINGIEILKDNSGVITLGGVKVHIGGEETSDGGFCELEFYPLNSGLKVGDIISYKGETATIDGENREEGNFYRIYVSQSGAFYQAQGSDIVLDSGKEIISYKRLLMSSDTGVESFDYTDYPNLKNKKLEIHIGFTGDAKVIICGDWREITTPVVADISTIGKDDNSAKLLCIRTVYCYFYETETEHFIKTIAREWWSDATSNDFWAIYKIHKIYEIIE